MKGERNVEGYEMFKNDFISAVNEKMPGMTVAQFQQIMECLDVCASHYDITQAETALSVATGGINALVKIFIASKTVEGQAKDSLHNRLITLQNFFGAVNKPAEAITPADIRVYLYQYQQTRGVSNSTLDRIRSCISSFFKWITAEGYIPKDPSIPVKAIKCEKKQRLSLSQIEMEKMRRACKTLRDKAILEFFYSTGCRVAELCAVKLEDVNLSTSEVRLFGKGMKHRTSYLNAKAICALQDYLATRNDGCEYLFVTEKRPYKKLTTCAVLRVIKKIASKTGIDKAVSPHVLRHTTATQAVAHGMPVEDVRKLLGHENISTTMIYVETSDNVVHANHIKAVV